jgi:hypothetical protein
LPQTTTYLVPSDLEDLRVRLSACESRLSALEHPAPPAPVPEPLPDPLPVPDPTPIPTPQPTPDVVRGVTLTTPDGIWTFGPNGETLLNGVYQQGRAEEYLYTPATGVLVARAGTNYYEYDPASQARWKAGSNPLPGDPAPTPPPPAVDPAIASPHASPDGTLVDQPWRTVTLANGRTFLMSDRKGSKDSGVHYIGYECGQVFDRIVPGIADQIPWTPATDDGITLPPRWVKLDANYQPIADDRPAFKYALIAGESYGYCFKILKLGPWMFQFAGNGHWYRGTGQAVFNQIVEDPYATPTPPEVLPAPAIGTRAMVGGWRFPIGQDSNLANPCTGQHCLAIDFDTMRAYVSTGKHGPGTVMEFRLPTRGEGTDPSQWPLAELVREIPAWWPYGYTSGLLFWKGKFWAAPKVFYDTAPPLTMSIIAEDGETLTLDLPRQAFAGFVKRGPGKVPYIGCGGDESGQGGTRGPSLATLDGKRLIAYGRPFIDAGGDPLPYWDDIAPRAPNYHTDVDSWLAFNPRVIDGELQGRWAADRVFSGGIELDGEIQYFAWMATGSIDYGRQEPTFGAWKDRRTYRYRYDASTFQFKAYELTGLGEVRGHEIGPDGTVYLSFLHQWSHPTLGMTVGAFA